jgi:hypothetical protein
VPKSLRGARLAYVIACVLLFLAGCYAVFYFNLRVVDWWFGMCPGDPACPRAEWLIQYWWGLFVPLWLLLAALAYGLYRRLFGRA